MRSIKTAIVIIMLSCTIISVLTVGILSIKTANEILNNNSAQYLDLTCRNSGKNLNAIFKSIEQSVTIFAQSTLVGFEKFDYELFCTSPDYVNEYMRTMDPFLRSFAENTIGPISVYIRLNPNITFPTAGLCLVKNDETGEFESVAPVDLDLFGPDHYEYSCWYFTPAETGKACWISPYFNRNVNKMTMSYVVPLYIGDNLFGVVGMDISYEEIAGIVNNISIYSTGYAFLIDDQDRVIVHRSIPLYTDVSNIDSNLEKLISQTDTVVGVNERRYVYDGVEKSMSSTRLENGMILILSAPVSEILHDSADLSLKIFAIALISGIAVAIITIIIATRLLKPATTDALTGLFNRFPFMLTVRQRLSASKDSHFALIMLDIDRFKNINDTYGHTAGDDALRQTAFYLNHVFSPEHLVGRFGGDEFLIFMQHVDKNMVMSSLDKVMTLMAIGGDIYDRKITCSMGVVYSDSVHSGTDPDKLLKKADEALYRAKAQGRNRYLFSDESIKDKTAKR